MHTNDDERTADMANPAAKYTDEFRRETADKWVARRRREVSGEPDPKAEDRELREARKRIRELELENAFLKKAAAFFAREQA